MRHILLLFPLLICFSGCAEKNPEGLVAVQGVVTLNGQPLQDGSIQFQSLPGAARSSQTGGKIIDGKYSVPATQGLTPGQAYTVRIRSMEEVPGSRKEGVDPMEANVEFRDIIPPRYGSASTLTVTATNDSPNVFPFSMER